MGSLGLGIDIGSTNTKVALVDLERAALLQVRTAATPDDALKLVDTVLRLVREVVALAATRPAVVGIASMAETGVPLDAQGAPQSKLLRWDEARDRESAESLVAGLGRESLYAATGVQPGPKAPLATWAWLRHTHREAWSSMDRWAGVSELIALALTGQFATDHTLAGRTMAYPLPAAGEGLSEVFDADLLNAVGMRAEQLPRVLRPGQPVGPVSRAASERSGLASGTPVFIAGHDHAVGSWAAGVRHPGDVADSVGTAEALVRVLAHPVDAKAALACGMSMTRTVTGEYESLLAGSASSGSFVRWFSDTHLDGHDVGGLLDAAAMSLEPSGVIVLPYLRGRQSPAPNPDARVRVLDAAGRDLDPASCSRERLAHAVYEALALQLRWMDAEQRRLAADAALSTLVVLGGPGAQSPAALAVKSAVLGARLAVVTIAEPVACGAALLAGSRLGLAVPPLPRRAVEPAPGLTGRYDSSYTTFVAAASASPPGEQ